ncbi:MAG: GHKL domain-containing protein [Fibrobacteres bacterium]|nr:GHKL domain-containing protein [Fibrobacterota bacterium]
MIILLQVICSFLFATGCLFSLIDMRTKWDRSFKYFGISLILLSLMAAIDLWVRPSHASLADKLFWERMLHVLACFFFPFSLGYHLMITRWPTITPLKILIGMGALCLPLVFTDPMINSRNGSVMGGPLYYALFFPFALFYIGCANYVVIRRLKTAVGHERKILWFHLAGFILLAGFGLIDMTGVANPATRIIPSFKIIGILVYGVMASLIFAERFLMILRDNQATFAKLETAYRDLEQVNALKQLGESTAIINHEIKNYMFMIGGNAQLLREAVPLSEKGSQIVDNIITSVERLTEFSDDILKLSRTEVVREKHPVNLSQVIHGTIEKHFPGRKACFQLSGLERERFMFGDWSKLEQVFVNIFNNSFEASGGQPVEIKVKANATDTTLVVSVEDDGVGCDEMQIDCLFKAFYTTKKRQGGTGLGMSITRTIVESHGGRISAYSKNLARKGEHGLKLVMTFPFYASKLAEEAGRKHPIALVKEGMDNFGDIIRVFGNLKVNPYVVADVGDLSGLDVPPESLTVIVSAKAMADNFTRLADYPQLCLVSRHKHNLYILDQGRGSRPEIFSEEYVASSMLRSPRSRTRFRERQHQLVP